LQAQKEPENRDFYGLLTAKIYNLNRLLAALPERVTPTAYWGPEASRAPSCSALPGSSRWPADRFFKARSRQDVL
jgi:hypothetical protein